MAITGTAVWEIRTTATVGNVNGGFYKPGATGTDYSQQNAAQYALTGGTTAAANAIILHASAAVDMVGNGLHLISGTNATAGWYEIISVVAGVSITVDRTCTSAAGVSMVFNIGGALSMNSATDGTVITAMVAFNVIWIKAGTYTMGANWNWASVAGTAAGGDCHLLGYNVTRGDNPTGANRPVIVLNSTFLILWGAYWNIANIITIGVSTNDTYGCFGAVSGNTRITNCKAVNTSTGVNHYAFGPPSSGTQYIACEFVCYFGICVNIATGVGVQFQNCYFHDSPYGIYSTYAGAAIPMQISGCTFVNMSVAGFYFGAASASGGYILMNNTFYGGETVKVGIGIQLVTSTVQVRLTALNNIFYGLVTGISAAANLNGNVEDYNTFNNNTTDRTNIATGVHSISLSPQFTSMGQYVNSGTVSSSGSTLTDTTASFANVVAGRDFLYVTAMTGGNGTGVYGITGKGTNTISTDNALGTGSSITYVIIYGKNLAVGTNMKAIGYANTGNPDALAYVDIGAVQRQELAGGGGVSRGRIVNAS